MSYRPNVTVLLGLIALLLFAACVGESSTPLPTRATWTPALTSAASVPPATDMPEYHWSQLLDRDDIRPIYEPEFVPADEAGYANDELVMGIAIAGEAKAYPVGLLNAREMVNDELAGIPILVTW